jgi:hypothetical protein
VVSGAYPGLYAAMPSIPSYRATLVRAVLAIPAGALIGGIVLALALQADNRPSAGSDWLILVTAYALVFLGGIMLISPLWWLLDRCGLRDWRLAALLGGVLTGAVFAAATLNGLADEMGGAERGLGERLQLMFEGPWIRCVGAMIAGALAGLVVWRIAYRKSAEATEVF